MSKIPSRAAWTSAPIVASSSRPRSAAKASGLMRFSARSGSDLDRRLQRLRRRTARPPAAADPRAQTASAIVFPPLVASRVLRCRARPAPERVPPSATKAARAFAPGGELLPNGVVVTTSDRAEDRVTVVACQSDSLLRCAGRRGAAGLPEGFSVALEPQVVAAAAYAEIAAFIRAFDRVTTREPWRTAALAEAPAIDPERRRRGLLLQRVGLPPAAGGRGAADRVQRRRGRLSLRRDHQCAVL